MGGLRIQEKQQLAGAKRVEGDGGGIDPGCFCLPVVSVSQFAQGYVERCLQKLRCACLALLLPPAPCMLTSLHAQIHGLFPTLPQSLPQNG